jgi:predicted NBD/HSP70 family sugar kinase/transcriptional regulator with XRE-family HTH domain
MSQNASSRWDDPDQQGPTLVRERDDLDTLAEEVNEDALAAAAYEDARRRSVLLRELANARHLSKQKLNQRDLAEIMGTTQSAVSDIENGKIDARLSTLQRYARACGQTLGLTIDGVGMELPQSIESSEPDDYTRLADEVLADPLASGAYDDARHRGAVLRTLAAAREERGLTQLVVAQLLGTAQSAVSDLENGRVDPRLSTLQRYARACGLALDITLTQTEILAGITGVLEPKMHSGESDPVVVEGVRLAASISIGETLRSLIHVQGRPGMALQQLVADTQFLSPPTKNRAIQGLTTRGWLGPVTDFEDAPLRLKLNKDAASFIGVSIRHDHVRGTLTSLVPNEVSADVRRVELGDPSPATVVAAVVEVVNKLRGQSSSEPLGIGVELSGPVDALTGTVLFAPDMQPLTTASWRNFPLEAQIQEQTGIRTVVENDAKALAIRELILHGAPGGLILVNMSESTMGIGSGLVFNDEIIRGADGESGEIGHITIDPNGKPCTRCARNRRGCLETKASGHAIAEDLGVQSLTEASRLAQSGDPRAREAFQQAGWRLGEVLGDSLTLLNPAQVVIYGPLELVAEMEYASADRFAVGVATGMQMRGFSKTSGPQLIVTEEWTGPLAAAAIVVNNFLRRPFDYVPDMKAQPAMVNGIGAA